MGALAIGKFLAKAPVFKDTLALRNPAANLPKLLQGIIGEHKVIPAIVRLQLAGKISQLLATLGAGGGEDFLRRQCYGPIVTGAPQTGLIAGIFTLIRTFLSRKSQPPIHT